MEALAFRVDELLAAGWEAADQEFDPGLFLQWKDLSIECLAALLGHEHVYCEQFRDLVGDEDKMSLLIGTGILAATVEYLANGWGELKDLTESQMN